MLGTTLSASHTSSNQIKSSQHSDELRSSAKETEAQKDTETCPGPNNLISDRVRIAI